MAYWFHYRYCLIAYSTNQIQAELSTDISIYWIQTLITYIIIIILHLLSIVAWVGQVTVGGHDIFSREGSTILNRLERKTAYHSCTSFVVWFLPSEALPNTNHFSAYTGYFWKFSMPEFLHHNLLPNPQKLFISWNYQIYNRMWPLKRCLKELYIKPVHEGL